MSLFNKFSKSIDPLFSRGKSIDSFDKDMKDVDKNRMRKKIKKGKSWVYFDPIREVRSDP
jgi:hypothetical protein